MLYSTSFIFAITTLDGKMDIPLLGRNPQKHRETATTRLLDLDKDHNSEARNKGLPAVLSGRKIQARGPESINFKVRRLSFDEQHMEHALGDLRYVTNHNTTGALPPSSNLICPVRAAFAHRTPITLGYWLLATLHQTADLPYPPAPPHLQDLLTVR